MANGIDQQQLPNDQVIPMDIDQKISEKPSNLTPPPSQQTESFQSEKESEEQQSQPKEEDKSIEQQPSSSLSSAEQPISSSVQSNLPEESQSEPLKQESESMSVESDQPLTKQSPSSSSSELPKQQQQTKNESSSAEKSEQSPSQSQQPKEEFVEEEPSSKDIKTPSSSTATPPTATISNGPVSTTTNHVNGLPATPTNTNNNNEPTTPLSPHTGGMLKKKARTASPSPSLSRLNTNMTRDQVKYSGAIMRNLKKHRDAAPFLHPVDYMKLNVPDYPKIIKHPMDLNTVDRKLVNGEYDDVENFISDVRLVFSNCYKFNGPEAMISMLCQNVESAFEKSLRQMPLSKEPLSPRSSPMADGKDSISNISKLSQKRARSPTQTIRRISEDARPKREIHPPPSKDYPEPMTKRRNPRKNDIQMKFCTQVLRELRKSKYRNINYPFLHPVDIVALNIPDYPSIVKHPMDLSTVERKLQEGDYDNADEFASDIRLMFHNCYLYNPPVTPVNKMGHELEKVFEEKWKQKPEPAPPEPEKRPSPSPPPAPTRAPPKEEFVEEVESEGDDRDSKIAELERTVAAITQQINSMKSTKRKKPERGTTKATRGGRSAPAKEKKTSAAPAEKRRRVAKPKKEELPEFTFEQKKDLSERINNLTGDKLNTVVNIIQSSMPNLDGQGQEEIVLDIDSLDRRTLYRLHEFVTGKSMLPKKPATKRGRTHYSEHESNQKIKALEQTLEKFKEQNDAAGPSGSVQQHQQSHHHHQHHQPHQTQHSSSESDSESSSGSDSDDSGSSSDNM